MTTTSDKLNRLQTLEGNAAQRLSDLEAKKQAVIDSVYTPEIREKIREINEEFAPQFNALATSEIAAAERDEIARLEQEIIAETITAGETQKGDRYMAVLTKEKVETETIVDIGMLKGMTVNIPKLQSCWKDETKTTPARVQIRRK